jgi:hypothetical protein
MFYIFLGDFLNNPLSSGYNFGWQKTPSVSIFDFPGATRLKSANVGGHASEFPRQKK